MFFSSTSDVEKNYFLICLFRRLKWVIIIEVYIVLLYCLMTDGSSLSQPVDAIRNTGFFSKVRIVLKNRSAVEGTLSVNLESDVLFDFQKFRNVFLKNSLGRLFSILIVFRFEVLGRFGISSAFDWLFYWGIPSII